MRNYIILNGTNSNTINGLLIQSLAPISKPLMRTEIEQIDGRDGDIVTPLGFSAYDKDITIGLYGTFDINQIIAFFNSEGTVVFSNEPDKYYNYQITAQIDFERLVRYRTATVTFHCQPFKFATTGETQLLDGGEAITGEGSAIVLDGTAEAPFNKLDLKGNTEQETLSGKNLFRYPYYDTANSPLDTLGVVWTDMGDGSIKANGTPSGASSFSFYRQADPLIVKPNTTYTMSGGDKTKGVVFTMGEYDDNGTLVTNHDNIDSLTFTTSPTTTRLIGGLKRYSNSTTINNFVCYPQLELGSTATSWEKFVGGSQSPNPDYPQDIHIVTGENTVKITGKNLFSFANGTISHNASTSMINDANSVTVEAIGTTGAQMASLALRGFNLADNYYFSCKGVKEVCGSDGSPIVQVLYRTSADGTNWTAYKNIGRINSPVQGEVYELGSAVNFDEYTQVLFYNNGSTPVSIGEKTSYYDIQLELGSSPSQYETYQSQSYTIDLGSLELCKIGEYEDKPFKNTPDSELYDSSLDDGAWYIHKEVGKVVLDGTQAVSATAFTSLFFIQESVNGMYIDGGLSDHFVFVSDSRITGNSPANNYLSNNQMAFRLGETKDRLYIKSSQFASNTDLRTWLGTHPTTVYYALATPTDTEITDSELIGQLEALQEAHSYRGRTHINAIATGDNLPHIIEVEANGDASGTITNAGNIYSKPKLTVYGSGNIGIYLNGVQMFQVALGSDGYITIDTNLMEAYKDNLQTLMNRQVIGDYDNFKLPVGESTISFSGTVTKCIVENYSRWL